MENPYEKYPVFENKAYLLRKVNSSDASDLLLVYADEKTVPFFNSDNCNGDDFHYTSLSRMQQAIAFWELEYQSKGFVRWAVLDKRVNRAIGTIELFNRKASDYYNNCGILRLDLRGDYEQEKSILEILSLILPTAFALFDCEIIATKVPPFASERKSAVTQMGFIASKEPLIGGHDGTCYVDYYVLHK